MRICRIMPRFKIQCLIARDLDPPIRVVFFPVAFLLEDQRRKKARQPFRAVNAAPRCHYCVSPAGRCHDQYSTGPQHAGKLVHHFDIAVALFRRDTVSPRNSNVLDRRTIDD